MEQEAQGTNSKLEWMLQSAEVSDPLLLEALLNRFYPGLYQFTLLVTNDPQMARYASGQALVQAVKIRHRYSGEISLRAWLYGLAYQVIPRSRRKQIPENKSANSDVSIVQQNPQEPEALLELLSNLDGRHQLALVLRHLHGLNLAEVANVLGIRDKRVHTRLDEVRRQCLAVLYPDSPRRSAHAEIEELVSESLDGLLDDHADFHSIARLEMHLDECGSCKAFSNRLSGLEKKIIQCVRQLWALPQLSEDDFHTLLPAISRQAERQSRRQSISLSLRAFSLAVILVAILAFVAFTTDIFAQTTPVGGGYDTPEVWKTPLAEQESLDHGFTEGVSRPAFPSQPDCKPSGRFRYQENTFNQRSEPILSAGPAPGFHRLTGAWETEAYW